VIKEREKENFIVKMKVLQLREFFIMIRLKREK